MSGLDRLLDPSSIAIAGLSSDQSKHGGRVLGHLRRLGYPGEVFGVNPGKPNLDSMEMYERISDLPQPPDLVVCAIPARAVGDIAMDSTRVGGLVVCAGGFGESGRDGRALESDLIEKIRSAGTRMLGPNSGGLIRPSRGLAASFLTCLERPADQVRSGPVGLVTQSGGTGSYLHNLAAARGSGLGVSVSTGNEIDIKLGEAIDAVSSLDEVKVVLAMIETVRDGGVFIDAVRASLDRGKPVVACRIGTGRRGQALMTTHTGAMAVPEAVLEGIFESLDVVMAETPGEAYEVAEMMARVARPAGDRAALVTHSGGIAIHLADLAERRGMSLQQPGPDLSALLDPLLDLGAVNNPLDMGGIIGGPGRFAEVIETFAGSGEYDMVLAVSTAHPPSHSWERVQALIDMDPPVPILHLWMAGDQASESLRVLREAGAPVTEEPRAAIRALAGLGRLATRRPALPTGLFEVFELSTLPAVEGGLASDVAGAVELAELVGYPVVVKVRSPGLAHKTEIGGVVLDLRSPDEVVAACEQVLESAKSKGLTVEGVRVERYRPGLEMIVGVVTDPVFGPVVSIGMGGVLTELLADITFAPAPVDEVGARRMADRLQARPLLDGYRGGPPADVDRLARIVSQVSRALIGAEQREIEINPLVWDGSEWLVVDLLAT